ncbi:MAG: ammonium transporter [Tepidisphaeraceae bacterium]
MHPILRVLTRPKWLGLAAAAAVLALPTLGMAQDAAPTTAPVAATPPHIDTGSTAWMLVSAALVLLMVPGLALFYGGMVRAKNVLNTFLNVMVCCGVLGIIWALIGYAMVFPVVDGTPGGGEHALVKFGEKTLKDAAGNDVKASISVLGFDSSLFGLRAFGQPAEVKDGVITKYGTWNNELVSADTVGAVGTGVPELVFAMFQGMFFIITPALIVGSIAERVRFGPLLLFLSLWSIIVYAPVAHSVWNVNGWLFQMGALDFAGGTVVHVLAGVSALALTIVVGPRTGYGKRAMPPHSLGYTLIGAGLLWFGWFGFNAGSAIGVGGADLPVSGGVAGLAFATTQIAAAAAATSWMLVEWLKDGKPTILGFASGMVAGLVVITPCAGFVSPFGALWIGLIGGAVCYFGTQLKKVFKYDDTLDAFGVHGVGGALGALLVGLFCVRVGTAGMGQLTTQFIAMASAAAFAFIVSLGLGFAIKATIGLRTKEADEEEGLDVALHGETGYNLSTTS